MARSRWAIGGSDTGPDRIPNSHAEETRMLDDDEYDDEEYDDDEYDDEEEDEDDDEYDDA